MIRTWNEDDGPEKVAAVLNDGVNNRMDQITAPEVQALKPLVKKYGRYQIVDKPKKEKTHNQRFKNNESVSAQKPVMSNGFNATSNTIPTFGQLNLTTGTGVVPNDTDFLPRQQGFMPNPIANLLAWTLDKMPPYIYGYIAICLNQLFHNFIK